MILIGGACAVPARGGLGECYYCYYLSLTYRTSCSLILGDSDDRVPDIVPHPAFTTMSLKLWVDRPAGNARRTGKSKADA